MPYRVGNIVRKGEIACYKQFLLFSQCFLQLYILSVSNAALCGGGLRENFGQTTISRSDCNGAEMNKPGFTQSLAQDP